jgi:hypothetical protein
MFPADQRDHIPKTRHMQVNQAAAVVVFFGRHAVKDCGGRGVTRPQHFRITSVDARVVLF